MNYIKNIVIKYSNKTVIKNSNKKYYFLLIKIENNNIVKCIKKMTPSINTYENYTYENYTIVELQNLVEIYDNLVRETKEEPLSQFNTNIIRHFEEVVSVIRNALRNALCNALPNALPIRS